MVKDQGVCLRVFDWSETSQTAWIFTRQLGLVRCVAKGSKREASAFSGGLEPCTRGEVVVSDRAKEKAAGGLATLASWDLQELYPAVRARLGSFYAGSAILDVVAHSVTDYDPHPALFDALMLALRELGSDAGDRRAMLRVAWSALADTGHAPELLRDVRTGQPLAPARSVAFLPRLGGFSFDGDASATPGGGPALPAGVADGHGPAWRVRAETLALLRSLGAGSGTLDAHPATTWRAAKLLLLHVREVFQCDPAAVGAALAFFDARP